LKIFAAGNNIPRSAGKLTKFRKILPPGPSGTVFYPQHSGTQIADFPQNNRPYQQSDIKHDFILNQP